MKKLSPRMEEMLTRLKGGTRIYVSCGIDSYAFWRDGGIETANMNTIWALMDRGLAMREKDNFDWRGYHVIHVPPTKNTE